MKMTSQFMVSCLLNVQSFRKALTIVHFFHFLECPGLAEWDSGMEVKNPLFSEETPAAAKTDKAQAPSGKAANQK